MEECDRRGVTVRIDGQTPFPGRLMCQCLRSPSSFDGPVAVANAALGHPRGPRGHAGRVRPPACRTVSTGGGRR